MLYDVFFDVSLFFFVQIYVTTEIVKRFSLINFLFIISQLPKLAYFKSVGMTICKYEGGGFEDELRNWVI